MKNRCGKSEKKCARKDGRNENRAPSGGTQTMALYPVISDRLSVVEGGPKGRLRAWPGVK